MSFTAVVLGSFLLASAPDTDASEMSPKVHKTNEPFKVKHVVVGGLDDGAVVLKMPFSLRYRKAVSKAQRRPLSSIPESANREVYIAPGGPSLKKLMAHEGQMVTATLIRDKRGATMLLDLELEPPNKK